MVRLLQPTESDTAEDQQDKYHSANLFKVISWVGKLCDLDIAPWEGEKVRISRVGFDLDW